MVSNTFDPVIYSKVESDLFSSLSQIRKYAFDFKNTLSLPEEQD